MTKLESILSRKLCHYQPLNILFDDTNYTLKNLFNLITNIDDENDVEREENEKNKFKENNKNKNNDCLDEIKKYNNFERNIQLNNEEFRNRVDLLTNIDIERDENNPSTTNNNTYHRFGGQNAIVAIMAFGNNQEDSVIFNAKSIEKGLFKNIFRKPVIVDRCTTFIKDDICYCCVEVKHVYKPQQGDKFASRYAQKGVIGSILPEDVLPRTEYGIIPDIIVNPHAFPSRMTVGHLIEMYVGKCMVIDPQKFGTFFDASIESNDIKNFRSTFIKSGIPIMEKMIDPKTGINIGSAFVGVCYYTALQHQVEEKMFYRITGNVNSISKQPTEGKANNGGLRIGEMEKDALVAHGANAILKDMFRNNTDIMEIRYCNICHSISTSEICCNSATKSVTISNSFNIMNSYLDSIGIHTTLYE
ncbi:beta and beta-prime subunits of DNA dependent RNA-polymerase [Piromyces finnis]|uniref:DNA-directed RNA polymerase n=1 Tax=Piromyces finnis TaxID=1754191 RepID=A0A1Y1UV29_9FUNG|nr:beta and beta-prime subunits of DNA dependent RNA-polymerase [Piromyces finnis]|eukprot:ORX41434.1 beta and beta-prime subunits of DNA dependent RNA-polymerase [Piromyces finnis]